MIVLQKPPNGKPRAEELLLANYALQIGTGVLWLGRSELPKRRVELVEAQLCAGSIPWVTEAMRLTERTVPEHQPYPEEAQEFLGRRVWREAHLYAAMDKIGRHPSIGDALFIKPADGWNRFTGFVAQADVHRYDPRFNGYSRTRPVWCSEPIAICSEWRAYVLHDMVKHIARAPYSGAGPTDPPMNVVDQCDALAAVLRGRRAGYVFDVAVIQDRAEGIEKVVLLEVNDGFSFGAYGGVAPSLILEIQVARWADLASVG